MTNPSLKPEIRWNEPVCSQRVSCLLQQRPIEMMPNNQLEAQWRLRETKVFACPPAQHAEHSLDASG